MRTRECTWQRANGNTNLRAGQDVPPGAPGSALRDTPGSEGLQRPGERLPGDLAVSLGKIGWLAGRDPRREIGRASCRERV